MLANRSWKPGTAKARKFQMRKWEGNLVETAGVENVGSSHASMAMREMEGKGAGRRRSRLPPDA